VADGIVHRPGEGEALRGELELYVEGEWIRGGPETFVAAPPGVEHGFTRRDEGTVRFLNIHAPGGFEHELRKESE
jgi:quercetin dioxygenase-like cupin family protein